MRKITLLLMACCLTLSLWAHDFEVDGIYYNIIKGKTNEVEVTSGDSKYKGVVAIPEITTHNGTTYTVTSIGEKAFYYCSSLTSVTISNSITSIGKYAFYSCSGLTSVTIPNSVTSIGYWAFRSCSGLTSITIPNSVMSIGDEAFANTSRLTSIVVEEGNSVYDSRENCNAIIKTATNTLIAGCKNTIIPNGITTIGSYAFYFCDGLTSITIPNTVTTIGSYAFCNCDGLTSITIPNSVTSIGNSAFNGCSGLKSMIVEEGNSVYDSRENCNAIIETASNTLIAGCKNTIIPNGITTIGSNAFEGCSGLTSITIPNSVTSIEDNAFHSCSGLSAITIPNSVTSIGDWAFSSCYYLQSVSLSNGLITIGRSAFGWIRSLKSITIPETVTRIGEDAFISTDLSSIRCLGITPPAASELELRTDKCILIVPTEAYTDYLNHAYWGQFLKIVNCQVSLSINNENWGIVSGDGYYTENEIVTLTATPNEGCYFAQWSDGNTENPRSFVITQNIELTAEFALNSYHVSVSAGEHGSVSKIDSTFNHGDTITIEAIADEHYQFSKWSDGNIDNPRTIEITSDTTLNAEFTLQMHEVKVSGKNGIVTGGGVYEYGDTITLSATPNAGCYFSRWLDGNTDNPRVITVTQDTTLVAKFAVESYNLELGSNLTLSSSEMTMTSYFYINTSVKNKGNNDFNGELAIGLFDVNQKFILAFESSHYSINSDQKSSVSLWNFSDDVVIPTGSYYVGVVYKMGEDWRLIKSTEYTYLSKLNVTYSDDLELYWLNISQEKLYSYGYIDVNVSILNTSFTTFYGMYRVSLCNLDGSVIKNIGIKYETQGLGYYYYYVNGFNLSSTLDVEPGTYLLQVAYKREGTDSWYYIGTSYANSPIFIEVLDPNVEEEILSEDQYEYNNTYTSAYALSYELQNDETTLNVAANIHEESYSNDVDYYSIATEKGYDYEIDVKLYDKYNQNLDETLTADVLFTYLIEGGSVSNIYDNSLTTPILIEGGQNVIICIEPYMHTLLGTYELEINIKRTKIQYYNVVVESANAAMGWTDGSGTYREGQSVSMQAYSHEGHHFVKWSDGNTDNPRTIVVTQDVTFTAEFAINTYNVIVNANENGSVTGSGTYNHGDTITLIATANEHYHFVKWSDGNTDNPRTIIVTEDITLGVELELMTYIVTVSCNEIHGVVSGSGTYKYGETVVLTATANDGYEFAQWSDGTTDNPYSIIVQKDLTLEAQFVPVTAVNNIETKENQSIKMIRNGQLLILRDGKTYSVMGQEM